MTLNHHRKFTREFKLQVLAEIAAGKSVAQAAKKHQLHRHSLDTGRNNIASIQGALSLATVAPTPTTPALLN
jgi:transposase-like protein